MINDHNLKSTHDDSIHTSTYISNFGVYSRYKYILDETAISRDPNFAKFGKDGIGGGNSNLIYRAFFFYPEHYSLSMLQPCIRRNFGVVLLVMRLYEYNYSYYIILNFEYIRVSCNFKTVQITIICTRR